MMIMIFWIIFVFGGLKETVSCPTNCECFGDGLKAGQVFCDRLSTFPPINEIPPHTTYLHIMDSSISEIPTEELYTLRLLHTLSITNSKIKTIGRFKVQGDTKLSSLVLNDNEISSVEAGALDDLKELVLINLDNNRLENFPVFKKPTEVKQLSLNGNRIKSLDRSSLKNLQKLNYLKLRGAHLTDLPAYIFSSNKDLWTLDLKYSALETIDEDAFLGSSLETLLLDGTKVTAIPARGLDKLKLLSLKNINNFWSIPPGLKRIHEVHVSEYNSFLCCAFYLKKYQRDFAWQSESVDTPSDSPSSTRITTTTHTSGTVSSVSTSERTPRTTITTRAYNNSQNGTSTTPTRTTTEWTGFGRRKRRDLPGFGNGSWESGTPLPTESSGGFTIPGGFQTDTVTVIKTQHHTNLTNKSLVTEPPQEDVICLPKPDAYHPCEDIMGAKWLTVVSLMVGSVAVVANLVVVVVVLSSERRFNVNRFLMSNLAFADFCLGLYLFIVVCVSLDTTGEYYNHVRTWQHGAGCQIAGFLAVFSTELSVYTLAVITVERFLAIVYAMQLNTRLSLRTAAKAMVGGWFLALLLAVLPLVGLNSYQDVAICLPFNSSNKGSLAYVGTILVLNLVSFVVIASLYTKMFLVVVGHGPMEGAPPRSDSKVAKRMSLLVFTDFICWMPIAFFGLVAALGYPLINVEKSKFLLVFFFPLNSLCNPFLYAFFTKAFKREFFALLSRFGFCRTRALHYKGTLSSLIYSRSRTKRSTVAEDDQDTKSKRISQISATEFTPGKTFLKISSDRSPSPATENLPMTGLTNLGYAGAESPGNPNNDQVFFESSSDAHKGESPKSDLWVSHPENRALENTNPEAPQLPLSVSTSSNNRVDSLEEKRAKKLSVSFREFDSIVKHSD